MAAGVAVVAARQADDVGTARHEACSRLNRAWQNWTLLSVGTAVDHAFSAFATMLCIPLLFPAQVLLEVFKRKILFLRDFFSCLATST